MPVQEYYIVVSGAQQGPFDEPTMMEWAASGKISPRTLVWRAGMKQWTAAGQVPELRGLFLAGSGMPAGGGANAGDPVMIGDYAGFWLRAVAFLIDGLTMMPFGMIVAMVMVNAGVDPERMTEGGSSENLLFVGIASLMMWIYFAWRESSPAQGTFGKRVMGLRVTDMEGRRLSFMRAFGRQMGRVLSDILMFGYILIAVTPRGQALHDLLAGTLVLRR